MSAGMETLVRYLGLAVPPLVALALWAFVRRRRRVAERLGDRALIARLVGEDLFHPPWGRAASILLAAVLLGLALTDPRWGSAAEPREARGGRVVLVLDASVSMLAQDLQPNRLERQRAAARDLVRGIPSAAFAVVVFAGRAYALVPPTVDRGALELYLESLDPGMVTQTGSSLSVAIRQGVGLLAAGDPEGPRGSIVLVSDGDAIDEPGQVLEAAALARRTGVAIFTLGAGTAQGAPVPDIDFATGDTLGFKRDPRGELIVTRLNEGLLREIARESGGGYAALDSPGAIDGLVERLSGISTGEATGAGRPPTRYAWFAAAALLLLLAESLSGSRRREDRG